MNIENLVSKTKGGSMVELSGSLNSELETYFNLYTDPEMYIDPDTKNPLSASSTTCCATGTCDNICT